MKYKVSWTTNVIAASLEAAEETALKYLFADGDALRPHYLILEFADENGVVTSVNYGGPELINAAKQWTTYM